MYPPVPIVLLEVAGYAQGFRRRSTKILMLSGLFPTEVANVARRRRRAVSTSLR